MPQTSRVTRRRFLQASAAGAVALGCPNFVRARASDKLNIAVIACGKRGAHNLEQFKNENIVALCDVDDNALRAAAAKQPKAKLFRDFRKLYDALKDSEFDAVVVSTPEHTHTVASMPALKRKKHLYLEKPITRDVHEARLLTKAAKEAGVATQMGTQNHANPNHHRVVELVHAGAIGPVRECHVWVSRTWGWQTKEEAKKYGDPHWVTMDRPKEGQPVPANLDWDLWIGPASFRPYHEAYLPGPRWYRWWDFGNGTMSDLGSHMNDLSWAALKLDAPRTIESDGPPPNSEQAPASMRAVYEYGPRGDLPAVKVVWYQGQRKPELWEQKKIPQWGDAVLFVGDKGMILASHSKHVLLPEDQFKDYQRPAKSIPDPKKEGTMDGQHGEWVRACKTGGKCGSDFVAYAGPLTEANHLGNVAFRAGKRIEWDPVNMKIPNFPAAEQYLGREYRAGWTLG
jgi:predicted dehydrogenase